LNNIYNAKNTKKIEYFKHNLNETHKTKLEEKFEIIIEIIKNNFDDNFIIKFLEEQNYEL
jgi:hypothetical protein